MARVVKRVIEIDGRVAWNAVHGKSGRWVAICDAMNLTTEADSLDELHSLIHESMDVLLRDLLLENEFDRFMKERGWRFKGQPPARQELEDVQFDVPLELLFARRERDTARGSH